jgi:hypothetical protein
VWGTVILMGAAAGLSPTRVGAVAFMLTRKKPIPLLLGYLIGGFGLSFIFGAVVVFVLKDVHLGKSSSVPPAIEIAVGTLALVVAVLVGSGISATRRDVEQARHPEAHPPDGQTQSFGGGPPGIESMPGFAKLPRQIKSALSKESPWVAWMAGLAVGTPNACYVAAIAAILKSDSSAVAQTAALITFNLIAFAQAEIPIVGFLITPDATRRWIERLYGWLSSHERPLVTVGAGVVGVYLVVVGAIRL